MPQIRHYKFTLDSFKNIKLEIKNDSVNNTVNTIMQMVINIYNSTHKIKEWENVFFINQLKDYPEILHLNKTFYSNRFVKLFELYEKKRNSELLIESFLSSRTFNLRDEIIKKAKLKDSDINKDQNVIMPIIDFYNHSLNSESYFIDSSLKPIAMSVSSTSEKAGDELMVCYNKGYDSINTYLSYGFIDTSSNFLKSIPLQFNIRNYKVQLYSNNKMYDKQLTSSIKNLQAYIPYIVKENDDTLSLSKLIIPSIKLAPFSLRRVLNYLLASINLFSDKELPTEITNIENTVINKNLKFWQNILQVSENKNDKNLSQLITLCELNLNHIIKYQQFHKINL